MSQTPTPTPAEWDLLEALWDLGPATSRQVGEVLEASRGWARSTVKTMLDRMAAKGLVEARKIGPVWEYRAVVRAEQARRTAWRRFVEAAFDGATEPALRFIAN